MTVLQVLEDSAFLELTPDGQFRLAHDRRDAQTLALSLGYSPLATRRYVSWLRTLAMDFVAQDRWWAEVIAVAETLVGKGRLSGNDVKRLLAERLFAKVGPLTTLGEE